MYVVNIGLDPKTLDPESVVAFRNRAYGGLVEHYSIVVPSPASVTVHLSDSTTVYGVGGMHKAVQLWKMYRIVLSLIKSGKCDVVTSQDTYFLGLLGFYFAKRYHLGFEVQVLGIEKLTSLRKRIAIFVLKRASVIRALSTKIKKRIMDEFRAPEEKIVVVPIYVDIRKLGLDVRTLSDSDTQEFERLSREFKEQFGSYINFLTVSRLVPIKRISMQIRALQSLVPEFPAVRLHIVGSGPEEQALKNEVKNLGLHEHVIFHGQQSGYVLGVFYIECDCFLLTSDFEGWGMVIIEAVSAGLPVIMTNVGCAGEVIVDGESGLVIPVGDGDALALSMRKIIKDVGLRDRLSVGATHALASLPSFNKILGHYEKNWRRALDHSL